MSGPVTWLGRVRMALLAIALGGAVTAGVPACSSVVHDDRGEASVTETLGESPVKVSYLASPADPVITVVIGTPDHAQNAVSLADASTVIGSALDQFDRSRRLPARLAFQPASLREPLLVLLRQRLTRPGANWNPTTGTVRTGNVYHTLASDVLAVATATPLAAAFARHGYRLASTGRVYHVEVGRVPGFGSAKLPTEIQQMGLVVVRER